MNMNMNMNKKLTIERKAELFDYIASRLDKGHFTLSFGGSEWAYHDQGSPEELAEILEKLMSFEIYKDEDEDEDE